MKKRAVSLRINEDVISWFKAKNRDDGYQTAMTNVLQSFIQKEKAKELRVMGRAQELYRQFYTQCFWHMKPDLQIGPENLFLIIAGLRKHGGQQGLKIAFDLEEELRADH